MKTVFLVAVIWLVPIAGHLRWSGVNLKRQAKPGCQSGQHEIGYTTTERSKSTTVYIAFNPPYDQAPAVVWGLTHLDSSHSDNIRINSEISYLSANGFILKIYAWGGTLTYNAKVAWMACPK